MNFMTVRMGALAALSVTLLGCASAHPVKDARVFSDGVWKGKDDRSVTSRPAAAPTNIDEAVKQAQAQRKSGDFSTAAHTLSQLVLLAPDDARVLGEYGKTLIAMGRLPTEDVGDATFWEPWERAGQSLYPLLDERIEADPELRRRVRVDMYRRLGFYPTETSEHSSEYVPWYLDRPNEVERLRIPVRDYMAISAGHVSEYEELRKRLARGEYIEGTSDAVEYAPQVVHSLATGTLRRIQVTMANDGLIDDLPQGAGVEVPALVDRLGVQPLRVGALPPQLAALNRQFLNVVELTVRAAVEGNPHLLRQAAMLDPHTAATLTVDQIWDLCNELVAAHGDALPEALRVPLKV